MLAKVQTVPRSEIQTGLPNAAAHCLVIAKVAVLKAQHARLYARLHTNVKIFSQVRKGFLPCGVTYSRIVSFMLLLVIIDDSY